MARQSTRSPTFLAGWTKKKLLSLTKTDFRNIITNYIQYVPFSITEIQQMTRPFKYNREMIDSERVFFIVFLLGIYLYVFRAMKVFPTSIFDAFSPPQQNNT